MLSDRQQKILDTTNELLYKLTELLAKEGLLSGAIQAEILKARINLVAFSFKIPDEEENESHS